MVPLVRHTVQTLRDIRDPFWTVRRTALVTRISRLDDTLGILGKPADHGCSLQFSMETISKRRQTLALRGDYVGYCCP